MPFDFTNIAAQKVIAIGTKGQKLIIDVSNNCLGLGEDVCKALPGFASLEVIIRAHSMVLERKHLF